jgi:hypothetical protein
LNNVESIYSEPFVLGGYPWYLNQWLHLCRLSIYSLIIFSFKWFNWFCFRRIHLYQKGRQKDGNLAIFLEAVQLQMENVSNEWLSKVWNRDVKFRLVVFNQLDTNRTITRGGNCFFFFLSSPRCILPKNILWICKYINDCT